jgi:hypothetical protein
MFKLFTSVGAISAKDGALTTLYAATSNEVKEKGYNGKYFVPYGKLGIPHAIARNKELQDNVWKFTQTLIRQKLSRNT